MIPVIPVIPDLPEREVEPGGIGAGKPMKSLETPARHSEAGGGREGRAVATC